LKYLRAIHAVEAGGEKVFHVGLNRPRIAVLPIFLFSLHITSYGSHLFGLQSVSASQQNTTIREISRVGSFWPRRFIQIDKSVLCLLLWKFLLRIRKHGTSTRIKSCQTLSTRSISRLANAEHFKARGTYCHRISCMDMCRC